MHQVGEIWKGQKKLKMGYTTGSCAAGAAKAAAAMLFSGEKVSTVSLMTPAGICLYLDVEETLAGQDHVRCAVRKDAGDDPDVTDGILVFADVSFCSENGIHLEGGEGIGRVTRKGLEQEIGQAAINKVPRRMILEAVEEEKARYGYKGGIRVVISIPEGKILAEKTFNPRLGIMGGISVLGTSGIVNPMSEKALIDTIRLEMKMIRESRYRMCYAVPGNYGNDFLRETIGYRGNLAVKCSNFIGETIDIAVQLNMEGLLFVGHVGKLIKLAAGIMNTHSSMADARMEILASHGAMAGASRQTVKKIMNSITTAEALEILRDEGILEETMRTVTEGISAHIRRRAGGSLITGAIIFSLEDGILGMTEQAGKLNERIRNLQPELSGEKKDSDDDTGTNRNRTGETL